MCTLQIPINWQYLTLINLIAQHWYSYLFPWLPSADSMGYTELFGANHSLNYAVTIIIIDYSASYL